MLRSSMESRLVSGWKSLRPTNEREVAPSPTVWKAHDTQKSTSMMELPQSFQERTKELPIVFQEQVECAWRMIRLLDTAPDQALTDPATRKLVQQLATSGIVGEVRIRDHIKLRANAPLAVECLPSWLQKDFLSKHRLDEQPAPISKTEEAEC